ASLPQQVQGWQQQATDGGGWPIGLPLGQYRGLENDLHLTEEIRSFTGGLEDHRAATGMPVDPDVSGAGQMFQGQVEQLGIGGDGTRGTGGREISGRLRTVKGVHGQLTAGAADPD